MASETVRITPQTYDRLKELSTERDEPMTATMQAAIDLLYRQRFLDDCDRAYARLKADPKAWKAAQDERTAWDATLADGLKGT
jgi:predicted transcriptional regulator